MKLTSRLATAALVALLFGNHTAPLHAVTIDWVTVGDPGNANDTTGYGAVNHEYRIGKYEVTIGQYAEFLNAVAKSDPYWLWNSNMETYSAVAGISRTGSSGAYQYSVIGAAGSAPFGGVSDANRPITYVTYLSAARFANWMHNGQGNGSTETGAYTLNANLNSPLPVKNAGAAFYIPSENEWYKAAYYSPVKGGDGTPGYYAYATQSDTRPGNVPGTAANQANYLRFIPPTFSTSDRVVYAVTQDGSVPNQNYLTDVGAFTNSVSYYGTFDQTGNVTEWMATNSSDGLIVLRDGDWNQTHTEGGVPTLGSEWRQVASGGQDRTNGFRLASPFAVPEPSTCVMALAGLACGGYSVFRRRKRA